MKNHPKVSVIIPTLHRADCIARAVESVVNQTYSDWELVVVDGASNDGTREIVERFAGADPRVRLIERANGGVGPARNIGIEEARGEFIAFLDSDDEFCPTKLERQMQLFDLRPDLGLVYCDYSYVDLEGRRHDSTFDTLAPMARRVPFETVDHRLNVCTPDLFEFLIQEYFIATIVGLVRRDVLGDDLRFWEEDMYGGEWLFYLEVARRCRAGFVDEPLCHHYFTRGSISRTSRVRNNIYLRRLLFIMLERFADASPAARGHMRDRLLNTCRQLGFDSYKNHEFRAAADYFSETLALRFDWTTLARMLLAIARWYGALGKPGREPILRTV